MEAVVMSLLAKGHWLGAVVIILAFLAFVGLGVVLRQKGAVAIGDKTKVVDIDALERIADKLGKVGDAVDQTQGAVRALDDRVKDVEHDLSSRPTRQEMHELEKSNVRSEEQLKALTIEIKATRETVARIDRHMYDASLRLAGSK